MKANSKGMGGHQSAKMLTDEWLTPPEIIKALGEFDVDPACPIVRPWDTARMHFTKQENGLIQGWDGRVWLNPPYGSEAAEWLHRLAQHGNGISLIFARTETDMFFRNVWRKADSIFFFEGRLHFYNVHGIRAKMNAGAPSCLVAYGDDNVQAIEDAGLKGKHVHLTSMQMVVVGVSPSWKSVVTIAVTRIKTGSVQDVYKNVEIIAPDKVRRNQFYKQKIRQVLQKHFTRIEKGVYTYIK
jgi:hypothetical protein